MSFIRGTLASLHRLSERGGEGGKGGETRKETLGRGLPLKPSNPDAVEDKIAVFAALFKTLIIL